MPDIDLDFARDIREQLILRVYERYGHDHAALVCTLRDLPPAQRGARPGQGARPAAGRRSTSWRDFPKAARAGSVRSELATLPEFQGQADGPLWAHLMELAEQIDGFPRHVGQHVGGMIISSRPLVELVPVQPASMDGPLHLPVGQGLAATTRASSRSTSWRSGCSRWSRSAWS